MEIDLYYKDGRFLADAAKEHWPDLREAGFVFDRINRIYQTSDWKNAEPFVECAADDETYDYLMGLITEREEAMEASYSMYADAEIVVPDIYNHKGEKLDYLPYQKAGILYAADRRDTLIGDPPGLGKGHPLTTRVLTPSGWRQIGDLVVGDPIIGADGRAHAVTGVYDRGMLETYRVEFNDGASVEVDGDHLWTVRRRKESNGYQPVWETLETRELIKRAYPGGLQTNKIEIPLVSAVEYGREMPDDALDPYVLGALLGDGGLRHRCYFSNIDEGVLAEVSARLPSDYVLRHTGSGCDYRITRQDAKSGQRNDVIEALRALGVWGTGSNDKAIPDAYKLAPPLWRADLLAGLMDTDGYVSKDGTVQFSSNSKTLRDDVVELVQSLGGLARKTDKVTASGNKHFIATINAVSCPFLAAEAKVVRWSPRVKYPPKRIFKTISPAGPQPVRCISVSAPDRLYVTEDFIVTHNTIQAIGLINHLELKTGVIVCPATLKLNWLKEMTKWLVDKNLTVGVAYGGEIPETDFVIINYDILNRNKEKLWAEHWDILVCDEAQYLSNGDSKRTQAIFGTYKWDYKTEKFQRIKQRMRCNHAEKSIKMACLRAEYRLMLTGTPMMKQPKDMWTIIRDFDPRGLGANWEHFAFTYCDATMTGFGMDASGGSNLEELNEYLRRTFMIRRLKKHVLSDLPRKTREVVVFPPEGMKRIIKTERDKFTKALAMLEAANLGEEYKPEVALEEQDPAFILDTMTKFLPQGFDSPEIDQLDPGEVQPGFAAYSEARHDLALSKVPMAVEHIKRLVDAGEKVIVFAIHKDVVAKVHEAFPTAARIIGGLGTKKVEAEKLRFQGDKDKGIEPDPECRVIICNLKAGGVGHTLTEATVVCFLEMWSVPGDMEQCEDRAHRIGLEHNVLVQYLVVDGTIDALTIQDLVTRIAMVQEGVDGKV
ncbi:RNA polymerase-associated protein [Erythrobacter phage vB_EliS-L02]|nr:RNA polymerase-associated protein [Erythrobacter phage vB_EliS-L02]